MPEKLKKGWRSWRFDQMAVMVNDRIDDPSEANVEYYVGLEHLDSDSLTIRRWGTPSDVEATKLSFRAGDIIFGRRRVYQRKLAVAHFDGICSAHAMVLRAKTDVVLSEFLPFFMQSDLFMERAKQISVGSLSPTINWKTLAQEEFALPPLEEQRRIAEVLQATRAVCDACSQVLVTGSAVRRALIDDFLCPSVRGAGRISIFESKWSIRPLGELCEITSGMKNSEEADVDGEFPFFTCGPEPLRSHTFSFNCEAILLPGNNASGVYKPQHYKGKFEVRQRVYVIRLREESPILYRYLFIALERGLFYLRARSVGTQAKFITISDLRSVPIPIPPADGQEKIVLRTTSIEDLVSAADKRQLKIRDLCSHFMSEGLRGDDQI